MLRSAAIVGWAWSQRRPRSSHAISSAYAGHDSGNRRGHPAARLTCPDHVTGWRANCSLQLGIFHLSAICCVVQPVVHRSRITFPGLVARTPGVMFQ